MLNKLKEEQAHLLDLADSMASAATSFNAHGYSLFIQAREAYISEVGKIFDEVISILLR